MTSKPDELTNDANTNQSMVCLPAAPSTASPVPWLTSLHAREGRGSFGDPRYRGNCSGLLIEDLLRYYQPKSVFDPMAGGGTCRDVCRSLGIPCESRDLHSGFDASDPRNSNHLRKPNSSGYIRLIFKW